VKGWFAQGLKGRNAEVWGLVLIVVGLIAALGIVADLAGPVGRLLRDQIGNVVGILRLVVPLALLWWGVTLLRSRSTADGARLGFGLGLLVLAATGMAHLLRGPESVSAPIGRLRDAGGYLGTVVAIPLEALTGAPGAWLILLVVAVFGALIALDVPLSTAAGTVARSIRVVWRRSVAWLRSLGRVGDEEAALTPDTEVPVEGGEPLVEDASVTVPVPAPDPEPPRFDMADEPPGSVEQLAIDLDSGRARGAWKLPPLRILRRRAAHKIDEEAVRTRATALEQALASHGVETKVRGMTVGPTVTRYELELAAGVKVAQVTSLSRDIAYAMAAADVRILAPIPGKSAIGVEVPNADRQIVTLGDILSGQVASEVRHPLEAALGQDISGRSAMLNLARMPHVLIAGATGSGK
jgi:S-DNA-T family DNA segregation ATPase FtsK/SpoIIIE